MRHEKTLAGEAAAAASHFQKEGEYWLKKLSGELVKSGFPYDYKKNDTQKPKNKSKQKPGTNTVNFRFPDELSAKLFRLMKGSDSRLHMILVAGLVLLLYKYNYNGNNDIIVGAPVLKQEVDRDFINTVLVLRVRLIENITFKDLLLQVRKTVTEATENQNYPLEVLLSQLNMPVSPPGPQNDFPLFDVAVLLENIHHQSYLQHINPQMIFSFLRTGTAVQGKVEYNALFYRETTIDRIVNHLITLMQHTLYNVDIPITCVELVTDREKAKLLVDFNRNGHTGYPADKTIPQLFAAQVEKSPGKIAFVYEREWLTYGELEEKSNQLANYLYDEKNIRPDHCVGILIDKSIDLIVAILGILKAGGSYVPIDPLFPEKLIKNIINDAAVGVVVSSKKYIRTLNRLQWDCPSFHTFLCTDSRHICLEEEEEKNELMGKKLWEYVGETATDEITGGGWLSSYTGDPIPKEEMDEYGDNILEKLTPLFHENPQMRVLEIGCASGITMYRLAPKVAYYYGTDLSGVIIEKNRKRVKAGGHKNIELSCLPAHEIDKIKETDFDIIIMNSVIQCFHGHNYLKKVIAKGIEKIGQKGYLFIGDVMDQNLKENLIRDLSAFKQANRDKGYKTKTDWSAELFVSREFFQDLQVEIPAIQKVEFSDKIYTMENELIGYRFDTLITVDKTREPANKTRTKHKYQHDAETLRKYGKKTLASGVKPGHLAYIMYTSGSTGNPKGVMVEHRSVVRLVKNTNYLRFRAEDKILQTGALAFDASTFEIWGALLNRMTLYLLSKDKILTPAELKKAIQKNGISTMWMTSPLFNQTLEEDIEVFAGPRNLLVGGDVLSPAHINRLKKRFPRLKVINGYGPTENTTFSTTHLIDKEYDGAIPIGKPIANSTAYIVDRDNRIQPIGAAGELYVGGDGVSRGYLNNPELTGEKFIPNPFIKGDRLYRTGDLSRWLPDGTIEFFSRIDTQVKIRGYRIELEEIENQLKASGDIKEAVVIDRENSGGNVIAGGDKYLCAYIVSNEEVVVSEVREGLLKRFPDYMVPAYFVQLDKIPLTANGKVDRKALPVPGIGEVGDDYIAPTNEVEGKMVEIWSQVLGIEKNMIGTQANFFQLGGHSLRATIVLSRIHKELNVKIPLAEIFKTPTIQGLAQYVANLEKNLYQDIKPIEKKEYYPQSSAQKRLFFLDHFGEIGTSYNMPYILKIRGKMVSERYEKTFNALIARHEALRTSFEIVDNKPVQRVHHQVDFEIEYYDIQATEAVHPSAFILHHFIRPFDLSKAPLLRAGLMEISQEEYLLLFDMHHIIGDGTSLTILVEDFTRLFMGKELPPLKIQYKDFSTWQNNLFETGSIKEQEEYWLNLYPGTHSVPILNLPTDYPRKKVFDFEGGAYHFRLNAEDTSMFKELASENGATLYMNLLAVLNVLLHKYSGQEDIIVGAAIAGRPHADLENIIGMFVNTLAVRNAPQGEKTYLEFLKEVKENCIKAFENQDMQFEALVERISPGRSPTRNPIFSVELNVRNFERPAPRSREPGKNQDTSNSTVAPYGFDRTTSKFDLSLFAVESRDEINFTLKYAAALFKPGSIEKMARRYMEILKQVVENKTIKIKDIDISPELAEAPPVELHTEFQL